MKSKKRLRTIKAGRDINPAERQKPKYEESISKLDTTSGPFSDNYKYPEGNTTKTKGASVKINKTKGPFSDK